MRGRRAKLRPIAMKRPQWASGGVYGDSDDGPVNGAGYREHGDEAVG